jgi:hypothetical protein
MITRSMRSRLLASSIEIELDHTVELYVLVS